MSTGIKRIISTQAIELSESRRELSGAGVMLAAPEGPQLCTATDWYTCTSTDGGDTYSCRYDYTEYDCDGGGDSGNGGNSGFPTGGDYGGLPPKPIGGGGGGSSSGGGSSEGNEDLPTLEYAESLNVINNLSNGFTKDPIEFYLVAKYKSDNILDLAQFETAGDPIKVGDYYLTPPPLR